MMRDRNVEGVKGTTLKEKYSVRTRLDSKAVIMVRESEKIRKKHGSIRTAQDSTVANVEVI